MNEVGFFDLYTFFILIPTVLYVYLRLSGKTTPNYNYGMSAVATFLWGTKFFSVYGTSEPFSLGWRSESYYDTKELHALRYAFLFTTVVFFQVNFSFAKETLLSRSLESTSKHPEPGKPRKETKKTY